ncbi:MAG: hypothetical protein M1818_004835 [Claussenomyces sp. TS43310]|nr:MAG: hypothetical protein M1818_004835 [Claussenomyces sp. TS43310]
MKLLRTEHVYTRYYQEEEIPDESRFTHTNHLFVDQHVLYYAQTTHRAGTYDPNTLDKAPVPPHLLPRRARIPNVTLAPALHAKARHTKYPNVLPYLDLEAGEAGAAERACGDMLTEIEFCELLRREGPHPNLGEYLGCVLRGGRIAAFQYVKYTCCLADYIGGMRNAHIADVQELLDGIHAGLRHIHGLGYYHGDLTPDNIMLQPDGTPIIIGFGSCRPIEEGGSRSNRGSIEEDLAAVLLIEQMLGPRWLRVATPAY